MLVSVFLSYLPYAFVTAFTPGPNNVLSLHSISQRGWRQGKFVLMGISSGFFSVMVVCALFCWELARYVPTAAEVLKYLGAAYVVWLAVHIARSGPEESEGGRASFLRCYLLQFINVKVILYAITVYTGYVLPRGADLSALLVHAVLLTVIGAAANLTWATAGGVLRLFINKHYRVFNLLMALVLLFCAVSMVLD